MDWVRLFACCLALFVVSSGAYPLRPQRPAQPSSESQPSAGQMPKGDIEHGRYIAERVVMCGECHSARGDGALRSYTDKQAMRLLTQGAIDRAGHELRPHMPRFHMTSQDASDVIAYMRSPE